MRIVFSQTAESKGSHIERRRRFRRIFVFFVPGKSRSRGDGVCMTEKGLAYI